MKTNRSWLLQSALMLFALLAVLWVMSLLKNPAAVLEIPPDPIPAKVQFGKVPTPPPPSK